MFNNHQSRISKAIVESIRFNKHDIEAIDFSTKYVGILYKNKRLVSNPDASFTVVLSIVWLVALVSSSIAVAGHNWAVGVPEERVSWESVLNYAIGGFGIILGSVLERIISFRFKVKEKKYDIVEFTLSRRESWVLYFLIRKEFKLRKEQEQRDREAKVLDAFGFTTSATKKEGFSPNDL